MPEEEQDVPWTITAPQDQEKQRMLRRALDDVAAGKAIIIQGSFWPKLLRKRPCKPAGA
jgi:hypothetical protein